MCNQQNFVLLLSPTLSLSPSHWSSSLSTYFLPKKNRSVQIQFSPFDNLPDLVRESINWLLKLISKYFPSNYFCLRSVSNSLLRPFYLIPNLYTFLLYNKQSFLNIFSDFFFKFVCGKYTQIGIIEKSNKILHIILFIVVFIFVLLSVAWYKIHMT